MIEEHGRVMAMRQSVRVHLDALMERYPALSECAGDIERSYELLVECFERGGKLLIAGNGGSAADAEHIAGELMKGFVKVRSLNQEQRARLLAVDAELGATLAAGLQGALPTIALDGHVALTTAYINDCDPRLCFAQQVNGYGRAGDVFLGISTSGNSANVLYAAVTARSKGMKLIGMTGPAESRLSRMSDVCIRVPGTDTHRVQELHLPVYHALCLMLEEHFF